MEALYPNLQPPLPSWLVRVAALGPHVRHAAGDIARLLKQDFGKFSETCFTAGGSEWNHAVRFLCAAATLRPALLAPDIHASTVLHALHMKEGLSQLYEYCQIIAAYGEQLQALDPNALKTMKDQAAWQAELDALRQEVEAWCTQAPQMTIVYAPATKVWRKWQERQGIIHALLLPVRENDPSKLQAAKQAVDRFSDDAQIKREVDYTDRKVLERRAGDAITAKALGQLRMHVREAIGFVRRWIELQDTRPGQSQSYLQRRAEQLRQEVRSRQAAALEDLVAFDQHNPSLPVASGIACCRKTLENIRTLFDQEAPLSVEEPDPRHLLHVDLLHLDSLPLNDQWEPDVADPQAMVESLLKLIAKGQSEWWQTFRMHCERRDHEATARIIEYLEAHLEVSPRLDEFQQTRDKHIRDCQAALRQDAEETRKQVDNAVAFGLLSEKGQVGYMTEIDSERGSRLPVLFECTLPFTFLEPYTTTAGLVPPEMFYGRMRERDSIVDPMGSCFIYGGRQLGKTALLRDVERTFHAPQEGRIARWLDLKVEGIGYDRPIEEIWHLLNKELKKAEVLPANLPDHTGVSRWCSPDCITSSGPQGRRTTPWPTMGNPSASVPYWITARGGRQGR